MYKAIKVRIYPNLEQRNYLDNLFGSCRFVYNKCLEYKKNAYEQDKTSISYATLGKYLTSLKKNEEHSWLNKSHSKVLQQSLRHLDTAYKNFFRNLKSNKEAGFPKFKSRHNKQSVEFRKDAISKSFIKGNRLNLIKDLKDILYRCSRRDEKMLNKKDLVYKSATLSKTRTGKYFLSILVETYKYSLKNLLKTNNVVGIDLGIKDFITTSDGEVVKNEKFIRTNQKRLSRLQRELSRKIKGSKNREKCRLRLAKAHEKIHNQQMYFLHQEVNKLISENQVICLEDLNVKGMMKNRKLARAIQELSLSEFKRILEYKSEWNNMILSYVDRFYPSSKTCSNCGSVKKDLSLKDRVYKCECCGSELDRDLNASINIKREGLRLLNQ